MKKLTVVAQLSAIFTDVHIGQGYAHLPFTGAQRLLSFASYDAPTYERMVAAAQEAERAIPELPVLAPSMISCAVWTVLFVGVSFVWFRQRDL